MLGAMLSEAGLDDGKIADVLGQSGIMMARNYRKEAELTEVTKEAVFGVDWTGKRRTKISSQMSHFDFDSSRI